MTDNYYQQVKDLCTLAPTKPGFRSLKYVIFKKRKYRGRERYVAGYSSARLYSHHMSGLTYETILGYGDTPEAAIEMMKNKVKP